jgi:beta-lactam-binding protein with PASTA domain
VRVFVSNGQAAGLPDVSSGQNLDFNAARSTLQGAGFGNVSQACVVATGSDPASSLDKVVAQNPGAGSVVNKGTPVTLTVRKASCGGPGGGGPGGGGPGGGGSP